MSTYTEIPLVVLQNVEDHIIGEIRIGLGKMGEVFALKVQIQPLVGSNPDSVVLVPVYCVDRVVA